MATSEPGRAERVGQDLLDLLDELRAGRTEPLAPMRRSRFSAATLAIGVLMGVLGAMLFVPDDAKEAAPVAASSGAGSVITGDAGSTVDLGSSGGAPTLTTEPTGGTAAGGASVAPTPAPTSGSTPASAGPPPPATAGSARPTANVRGVTANKIKIGVTVLTGGEALTGPLEESYRAVFDGFRKSGQLPVHGRDVDLVFRNFSLTGNEAEMRSACVQLAQEDKIFAGIIWLIAPVNECLAREFKIPSITGYLDTETMRRTMPYVFATAADLSAQIRNVPHWAHANNLIKGKKLGLYYRDSDVMKRAIEQLFKPQLKALGYELAAEVAADGSASSPALAVQRFRAAGVDTIFLQARPWDFGQAAEAQAYRPQYLLFSAENNAQADGIASYAGALPQQFDKAWSVTANRFGESGTNGNPPPVAAGVKCQQNYERYTGRKAPRSGGTAQQEVEWQAIQHACDQGIALMKALQAMGPNLSEVGLIRALETNVKAQQSGVVADITFSPADHFGGHELKTNQFGAGCICWLHRSGFRPFWV